MIGLQIHKRLKADFTWVLSGNVLYSLCQWSIVMVLAKLGRPSQVGEYALGIAISAPIVLFANLQLRVLVVSDSRGEFTFSQYLVFRLVSLGLALLVVAGVAAGTQPDWSLVAVVVLVGFGQVLEYLSDTYYGFLQKQERMDLISVSLLMKGPLSVGLLCAAMYFTRSVVWALTALALGRLIILLLWDARLGLREAARYSSKTNAHAAHRRWPSDKMLMLLRMALPLGFISMLISLNSSIPRYFVEAHLGSAELGIFSAVASLLTAGTLVVSAFGQAMFLPVAQAYSANDRVRFRTYAALAVVLGAMLGGVAVLVAALFGRSLLAHLFRPEYGEHPGVLVRLMIAGMIAFIASGLGYVITAARRLRSQIPVLGASALAAAATSAWSIPRNGLDGAADAALAAALVQLAGIAAIFWASDRQLRARQFSEGDLPSVSCSPSTVCEALSSQETVT